MKKTKKILQYFLLFLFALIAALFLLPNLFQDELKLKVKEYLNSRIEAEIDFSDIHLSALTRFPKLKLSIDNLSFMKNAGFKNDTIFFSEKTVLELPIYSLWEKEKPVEVYQFELNQPKFFILVDKEGKSNYDIIPDTESSVDKGEIIFNVQSYKILGADLDYDDGQTGIRLVLNNLDHEGSGDFSQTKFALNTQTDIENLSYYQMDVAIIDEWKAKATGKINVDLANNYYELEDNTIQLNHLLLAATGSFKFNLNNTDINLDFESKKNGFKEYLSLLPNVSSQNFEKIKAGGTADVKGYIKGIIDSKKKIYPHFKIESNIENAHFQFPDFKLPVSNIFGKLLVHNESNSIANTEISLNNFTAKIKDEVIKLSLRGKNLMTDPLVDCRVEGKLDLQDLKEAYPFPDIRHMEGNLSTNFHVLGRRSSIQKNKYEEVSFEGQMTGQAVQIDFLEESYRIPTFGAEWSKEEIIISAISFAQGNTDFFAEGKIQKPLDLLVPDRPVNANIILNAKRLDLNAYLTQTSTDSLNTTPPWMQKLKFLNINWQAEIGELNYETYTLLNNKGDGSLSQDKLNIDEFTGILSGSDFKISGNLDNVIAYATDRDTINGTLILNSKKLNANSYLDDQKKAGTKSTSPYPAIPPRINIKIISKADQIQYGLLSLAEITGQIDLLEQKLEMRNFVANLLGGGIKLDGSYQQKGDAAPEFAFKYNMEQIPFVGAFQSMPSIQKLAPLFSFIEGVFNTTLIMNGKLGENLFPDLSSLTAAGYMETQNGEIISLPYLDKLQNFFSVNIKEAMKLTNTKNWFEIENGTFTLREYKHVWKDIEFSIAGTHSLNKDINYIIKAKVPKSKINQSAIGNQVNKTLDDLISKAMSKGIIKANEDPYLLLDFNLTGNMKNPLVSVQPRGVSGLELVNPLEQILTDKKQEIKETAENKVKENKEAIEKEIKDKTSTVIDSIKKGVEQKKQEAIDKAKGKAGELIDSTIKNQIPKTIPDTLKTQIDKTVGDLFGDKSKEEIKDKLKDFNPFKKKKKNN